MKSTTAKAALLSYCRFAKQMPYVATEVSMPGDSLADVAASDGKNLIEYEVKVSMSDLKSDSKKYKHIIYNPSPIVWDNDTATKGPLTLTLKQGSDWGKTKYYFYTDKDEKWDYQGFSTKEKAMDWLEKEIGYKSNNPNMLYYVIPYLMWDKHQEKILESIHKDYGIITFESKNYHAMQVVKKAKKLHKNEVNNDMLITIVKRMSSELANLTNMYYNHVENMTQFGKMIEEKFSLNEEVD